MTNLYCILCKSSQVVNYFTKFSDHGKFSIRRCKSCGGSFVWPRPDKDAMAVYYESQSYHNLSYEAAILSDSKYYPTSEHDSFKIINKCKQLALGNCLLDIGCGFGAFSKAAIKAGFDVAACEPNPNARKVFKAINGFDPDATIFDRQYALQHKNQWDVILLSQVLEHIPDVNEIVRNIQIALKNDGIAAIAVPHFGSALSRIQGKKDMFISPPEHLNFFTKKSLIKLFEMNGFKLVAMETVSKVPREKIEKLVGIPVISQCAWLSLYGALKSCELFGMGMVLNAYFRKISQEVGCNNG